MRSRFIFLLAFISLLGVSCGREFLNPADPESRAFDGEIVVRTRDGIRPYFPEDGAEVFYPDLQWGICREPTEVQLQVSRDSSFSQEMVKFSDILTRSRISIREEIPGYEKSSLVNHPDLKRLGPGLWFWRVRTRAPGGIWGPWSDFRSFRMRTVLQRRIWSVSDYDGTQGFFLIEEPDYGSSGEIRGGAFYDYSTGKNYKVLFGEGDKDSSVRYRQEAGSNLFRMETHTREVLGYWTVEKVLAADEVLSMTRTLRDLGGRILSEERYHRANGGLELEEVRSYMYDGSGLPTGQRVERSDARFEFTYDKGKIRRQDVYDASGKLTHYWIYHYDLDFRRDLLTHLEHFKESGEPGTAGYYYLYNLPEEEKHLCNVTLGVGELPSGRALGSVSYGTYSE